jgi:hypothetical protein
LRKPVTFPHLHEFIFPDREIAFRRMNRENHAVIALSLELKSLNVVVKHSLGCSTLHLYECNLVCSDVLCERSERWQTSKIHTLKIPCAFPGCKITVGHEHVGLKESLLSGLTIISPLTFPLTLNNGQVIETVGDAAAYFGALSAEQLTQHHWKVAVRMLDNALNQPTYLRTATMSLQTALLFEGILASPLAVGGD